MYALFRLSLIIVVAAFNVGGKTTEETLEEVSIIVKDRSLNQRFRDLIYRAIAEKENQLESDVGNETLDGDMTVDLDLDQNPILEDDAVTDRDEDQVENHDIHVGFSHQDKHGAHSIQDIIESMQQDHGHAGELDQDLLQGLEEVDRHSEAKVTLTSDDKNQHRANE